MFQKTSTSYTVLFAIAIAHLLNDLLQGIILAMYPQLERNFNLSMTQIGMITLCFQLSSSIFQPIVGAFTDKYPKPYSQVFGMLFSAIGIVFLAYAVNYYWILIAVTFVGIGSSIFHPESSRVAFLASGGRRSLAQSIFQLGGNSGSALAPLLVAWLIIPNEQRYIVWFVGFALLAKIILLYVGRWRSRELKYVNVNNKKTIVSPNLSQKKVIISIVILLILIFSKYFYIAGITSYFQFYTMQKFNFTEVEAQVYLFYFLGAAAIGTLLGGVLGDKFGRKFVIWISILGVAPFALCLPYSNEVWTGVFIVFIGLIISSAFPAILVYSQELLPKKIGTISGLFYGFAFGMGGLASAILGRIADSTNIAYVYNICSFLPLIGLVTFFLPNLTKKGKV